MRRSSLLIASVATSLLLAVTAWLLWRGARADSGDGPSARGRPPHVALPAPRTSNGVSTPAPAHRDASPRASSGPAIEPAGWALSDWQRVIRFQTSGAVLATEGALQRTLEESLEAARGDCVFDLAEETVLLASVTLESSPAHAIVSDLHLSVRDGQALAADTVRCLESAVGRPELVPLDEEAPFVSYSGPIELELYLSVER